MKQISVCVLAVAAFAAAFPTEEAVSDKQKEVLVTSIPPKLSQTGAIPIPVSVVLAEAMKAQTGDADETKKLTKRWWHEEESTPAPHGWPAPTGWQSPPHTPPASPLVGPFAFQLGAYYNPMIPAMVENPPSYPQYPSAPHQAYTPGNIYAPSPAYSNPSTYASSSASPY